MMVTTTWSMSLLALAAATWSVAGVKDGDTRYVGAQVEFESTT